MSTPHTSDQDLRSANQNYRKSGFEELEHRLRTLMDLLAQAMPEGSGLADSIPWRGQEIQDHSKDPEAAATVAQLQAVCFEILNMVEERTALKIRQRRRSEQGLDAEQGMWARVLYDLKEQGFSEDEVLAALPRTAVTPVLTAHPTEAKRPTVRERHLAIYRDLVRWDRYEGETEALANVMQSIQVGLETLWHTGEIHASRPSLIGELRHIIYYLREVYPTVVRRLDVSLETAWKETGWDVAKLRQSSAFPHLRFGTWVGGDRDGHPLVTEDVTRDALMRLRKHCHRMYARELRDAATVLTLSPSANDVPAELSERITALHQELGSSVDYIIKTNQEEPWRCLCFLMREKLTRKDQYLRVEEYTADLDLLESTLTKIGAETTARGIILPLKRLAQVFGFHLATLDIRQNSPFHDAAAAEMLAIAGVKDAESFPDWPEQKRIDYLLTELQNERPFRPWKASPDSEASKVMACLDVLHQHTQKYGSECLGPYIISMTRQVSDMLLVHLFAREGRMATWCDGFWVSNLPVCPLFETGDDLDRAGEIVTNYLALPSSKSFLRRVPGGAHCMPVMVGYSDSNKDAGLLSGQWSLQKAQCQIAAACHTAGVTPEFFHGRGGTISRGAGPVQWFLRSLPHGSLGGAMRVTEQGEVIPRKYAHHANAAYNLELLLAGVTGVSVSNTRNTTPNLGDPHYQDIMGWLSQKSRTTYQNLLSSDGFIEFYRQATPIDALEHGCFGSRPSRRTGTASLSDLRAIPWVFSWTQARFYMPGWFGVGTALEQFQQEKPDDFAALSDFIRTESFLRYLLTNVETNLVSADLQLMKNYADLVSDTNLKDRFMDIIVPEFSRTQNMIDTIFGSTFEQRRPRMQRTLDMRERPLRLLHRQQIELLHDWRQAQAEQNENRQDTLLNALQYSVNAIASGLRTTG